MKRLVLYVLILSTLVCYYGCIYIPVIYTTSETGSIDPSFITSGVTTKEEVILRCGAPNEVRGSKEEVITYQWSTFRGVIVAWLIPRPWEGTTFLTIEFDENDIVKGSNKGYKTTQAPVINN